MHPYISDTSPSCTQIRVDRRNPRGTQLMQIQIATLQKINANRQMRCQKGAVTKMHKCLVGPSVKGASEKVNFQTDT